MAAALEAERDSIDFSTEDDIGERAISLRLARAAIMAIREPSNSTVEALMFETPPELHAPSACRTVRAVITGYVNHILGETKL